MEINIKAKSHNATLLSVDHTGLNLTLNLSGCRVEPGKTPLITNQSFRKYEVLSGIYVSRIDHE